MGQLIDGKWSDQWYDTRNTGGKFKRAESAFRNWVTADGSPAPSARAVSQAESGRYHLYVSYACPWAHRTLIFRALKGLEDHISVSAVVSPRCPMKPAGPLPARLGSDHDTLNGADYLWQVYTKAIPDYTGRVTVPVLWDKKTQHDRVQRERRNHPHVQFGIQCDHRKHARFLPRREARANRCDQRPRLRRHQQRRLQGRLCHHASQPMKRP